MLTSQNTFAQFWARVRRRGSLALCLALCTLGMGTSGNAQEHRIITFDAPHSGTNVYQGTAPAAINLLGIITGSVTDSNYGTHGFVRTPDGQFTEFDAPGADPIVGGTYPELINHLGVVMGYDVDTNGVSHGFLRSPDGRFTTIDAPGASAGASPGTFARSINLEGVVVGGYYDANNFTRGFRRAPDGTFTTFVAPGECTTNVSTGCHGTGAWNINIFGVIVGPYEDNSGNFVAHTYIRFPDGTFRTFAVPGSSMEAGQGTLPAYSSGLNDAGAITGTYYDANNVFHGYLRNPNGTFIKFEAPGADTTTSFNGTFPETINDLGVIAGYYLDANEVYHGFLRNPDGTYVKFEAPGADANAGDYNGTYPININLSGSITGYYIDVTNVYHGFIRRP
jgi:hypothetical protein